MEQSGADRDTIASHFYGTGAGAALYELLTWYPEALCLAPPPPTLDAQADEAYFSACLEQASESVNHELNTWLDAHKRSRDVTDHGSRDSSPPPTSAPSTPAITPALRPSSRAAHNAWLWQLREGYQRLLHPAATTDATGGLVTHVAHVMVHNPQPVAVPVYEPPVLQHATLVPSGTQANATSEQQQQLADMCEKHRDAFAHSVVELKGRGCSGSRRISPLRPTLTTNTLGGRTHMPPFNVAVTNERFGELLAASVN